MKPLKLIISGWGPYAEQVEVDFSAFDHKGLYLITGPTGGGKTTIFDAITYALYGDVSGKNREKTSVRSDFSKPETDTFVELFFTHKATSYQIRRTPKYSRPKKRGEGFTISNETAELFIDDKEPIAVVTDVNRAIEQILGISYEQFKQIAMIAQGEFMDLLLANSKDRVEIFRNLFHTEDFERLQRHLSRQSKELYDQIKTLKDKLQEAIDTIDAKGFEELEELKNSTDYQYEKIFALTAQLIEKERNDSSILDKSIIDIEDRSKQLFITIKDGEYKNERIALYTEITKELDNLLDKKASVNQLRERIKLADLAVKASGEEKVIQNLDNQYQMLNINISKLEKMIEELTPVFLNAQIQKDDNLNRIEQLDKLRDKEMALEGLIPLLKEMEQKVQEHNNAKIFCMRLKEKEEDINQQLDTLKEEEKINLIELESLKEADSKLNECSLSIEKVESNIELLKNGIELCNQIQLESDKLKKLQQEYTRVELSWIDKRERYEKEELEFRKDAIGIVVTLLKEGEPCPVCGSTEHPRIAEKSGHILNELELKTLKADVLQLQTHKDNIYEKTLVQKLQVDNLYAEWNKINDTIQIKDIEIICIKEQLTQKLNSEKEILSEHNKQIGYYMDQLKRRQEILLLQERLSENRLIYQEEKEQILKDYLSAKSKFDELTGIVKQMEVRANTEQRSLEDAQKELDEVRNQRQVIQHEIKHKEENFLNLKDQLQEHKTLLMKEKQDYNRVTEELSEANRSFLEKLTSLGFSSTNEYKDAFIKEEEYKQIKKQLEEYDTMLQLKMNQKKELDKEVGGMEPIDLSVFQEELKRLETQKNDLQKDKESVNTSIQVNLRALKSMTDKWKIKEKLEEEYGTIKDLDDVTKGNNPERVVFEHYVLSVYFEEILRAANQRLSKMSVGRYELQKVSKVSDARTKDSLDLEVLDNYTGKKRSVKTLSGGESFKAALSLALGLSDIVQNNAGGIHIDTLFIDEGFGALDSESLDQAINTLMVLSEQNRLIGIISHVNELKERIDNQVVIEKTSQGSSINIKTL